MATDFIARLEISIVLDEDLKNFLNIKLGLRELADQLGNFQANINYILEKFDGTRVLTKDGYIKPNHVSLRWRKKKKLSANSEIDQQKRTELKVIRAEIALTPLDIKNFGWIRSGTFQALARVCHLHYANGLVGNINHDSQGFYIADIKNSFQIEQNLDQVLEKFLPDKKIETTDRKDTQEPGA